MGKVPVEWGESQSRGATQEAVHTPFSPPPPVSRPHLASLTAFCRHRCEPSEDERLPVDAGHITLQPCPPKVRVKLAGLKAETKRAGNIWTRASEAKASSSRSLFPCRRRQLNHAYSVAWLATYLFSPRPLPVWRVWPQKTAKWGNMRVLDGRYNRNSGKHVAIVL